MKSVCAVIAKDGLFLASHRRYDPNLWDFIGGKVDDDETPENAMHRECLEETGFIADFELFDIRDDGLYEVYVFIGTNPIKISSEDEGMWKYASLEEVCNGAFKDFNAKLLTDLNII